MADTFQGFDEHDTLFGETLLADGWEDFDEGEAAFEGLAELVEIIAIEAVESADDAEILRDRQFGTTIVGRYAQEIVPAEGGKCITKGEIDGSTVELVDDQPLTAKSIAYTTSQAIRSSNARTSNSLNVPLCWILTLNSPVFENGGGEVAVLYLVHRLTIGD